jgi:hypothetical protein
MSYIPKYILKRMLPKECVKLEGDTVHVEMVNVISPLSIDEIPDNYLSYLSVKIDDKEMPEDKKSGIKIGFEDKIFTTSNIKDAVGVTLAVGGKLNVFFPNFAGVNKGETHNFEVLIKSNNPINIQFEREVM